MPSISDLLPLALVALGSYLWGAIPVGLMVGKVSRGVDLRQYGSGKTGATNALRVLGARGSAIVFVADVAKGLLPVVVAGRVLQSDAAQVVAGLSAIAGHNWSVFIGFQGGRGVSTGFGALLGMAPLAALVTAVVGIATVWLSRYVSLGSVLGAVAGSLTLTALVVTGARTTAYLVYAVVGAALVVLSHWDNIQRLLAGTERRLGERAMPQGQAPEGR